MTTRHYIVTIHDVGNITNEARNVHTILTSRDFIAPRERVEVREVMTTSVQEFVTLKNEEIEFDLTCRCYVNGEITCGQDCQCSCHDQFQAVAMRVYDAETGELA